MRLRVSLCFATAVAAAALVVPASTALAAPSAALSSAATAAGHGTPRVTLQELTDQVSQQVRAVYPHVYLVEVDGVAPGGSTTDIADVSSWTYRFDDVQDAPNSFFVSVTAHTDGTIEAPQVKSGLWVGSTTLHPPIAMDPTTADRLLKTAGYTGPYKFVTLRQPNSGAYMPHPLYIFDQITPGGRKFVSVDTVTGEVAPIS